MAAPIPILFTLQTELGWTYNSSIFPEGIRFGKSAIFTETGIIGRSSPIITYSHSGPTTLEVNLEIYADAFQDGTAGPGGGFSATVDQIVECFRSLTYPVEGGIQPPTLCTITVGTMPNFQAWQAVCEDVQIHYGTQPVWSPRGTPHMAAAACRFKGVEVDNVPASQFISAGNFRELGFSYSSLQGG